MYNDADPGRTGIREERPKKQGAADRQGGYLQPSCFFLREGSILVRTGL